MVGTGCSAIQIVPAIQPIVAPARRLPALARAGRSRAWTSPTASGRKRLFERCPGAPAPRPRVDLRVPRGRRRRDDEQAVAAAGVSGHRPPPDQHARSRTRSCARKVTPTDEIGCKRVMLTDDWYPTLTRAERRAGHRPDRDRHARRGRTRGRTSSGRPTCSCSRPGSRPTASWRRWRSPAPAAGRLAEEWAGVPRAYLGLTVPGFPEPVPDLRPEHQRRHGLGDLHDRVAASGT